MLLFCIISPLLTISWTTGNSKRTRIRFPFPGTGFASLQDCLNPQLTSHKRVDTYQPNSTNLAIAAQG